MNKTKIFTAIRGLLTKHAKEFAKAIPVVILIFVAYVQCTKIGSKMLLETPGVKWYIPENSGASREDLLKVSNRALGLLHVKGIDTKDFDVNLILCGSTDEFLWKSLVLDAKTLGVTRWQFQNITINNSSIQEDKMEANESKLSEIIAHELCHIYLSKKLSLWKYSNLETWKEEGFAEYVSEHSSLSIEKGVSLFLANNNAESEKKEVKTLYSYFISRLKTDYLLRHKGVSFDEFIDTDYDENALETEIREALKNGDYEYLP